MGTCGLVVRPGQAADMRNSVPADFVSAPDPISYWRSPRPAMVKVRIQTLASGVVKRNSTDTPQPAANSSFKPVNTLTRGNGGHVPARPVVYGKKTHASTPSRGQQAFVEQYSSISNTPARKPPSRSEQNSRLIGSSSWKKRKTGHSSPPHIIDLSEDDDVQEIPSHQTPTASTLEQYDMPHSTQSARSRHSVGSNPAASARQSGSQSRNEFQAVENMMNRPRTKNQPTPVHVLEDDAKPPRDSARKALLKTFRQGVSDGAFEERMLPNQSEATTSHHFPNARINESTSDITQQKTNRRHTNGDVDLRSFRRNDGSVEDDGVSDDELGMDLPQQALTIKTKRSGSNATQIANSGAKRTSKAAKAAKGAQVRPLIWARSHNFDSHYFDNPRGDAVSIWLKPDSTPKAWRIVGYDADGNYETKATITPQHVVKVWADDVGRIRLEGSRRQDGNQSIYDLEFLDTDDFREFRDTDAVSLSGRPNSAPRPELWMKQMFGKELARNDKVGTLPMVSNSEPDSDNLEVQDNRAKSQSLWSQMKSGTQNRSLLASTSDENASSTQADPKRASARPARATRSSAPTHDLADDLDESHIEKYSVTHGLGKPWRDPLNFGEGRQRATVNFTDLQRLDEGEFLNDNLIDFYMIYCFEQHKVPRDKVYFFNTFFYTRLTENTGRASMNYEAVKRWTSKIDIFLYDYIVVPINEDTHWYLAIICNVGNIKRKAVQEDFADSPAKAVGGENAATLAEDKAVAADPPTEPKLINSYNPMMSSRAPSAEQAEEDGNLFDEESTLDLIDREETAAEGDKRRASPHDSYVPQSTEDIEVPAVRSIFDHVDVPKTVLSNLKASPKKKSKRKFTAPKKDPDQPIIIILDSLSSARSSAVRALKDWLAAEGRARRSMEAVIREKGFYPKANQIPTQSNFSDCGVYLLGYAEKFFQNPDEFKTKLLQGEMTADEDWPQLKPKDMRHSLREIIQGLANEQELTEPKKKRGKKAADASKPLPTQPTLEPVKSMETSEEQTGTVATNLEPPTAAEQPPHKSTVARLGSPFSPKLSIKPSVPNGDASRTFGKVTSATSSSPERTNIVSPLKKTTPSRWTYPEVRIPKRSPTSNQPRLDAHIGLDGPQAKGFPHQSKSGTRSVSPLKRTRQEVDAIDVLQTPPKKKRSSPIAQSAKREKPSRTSPLLPPPQEGHSDHPIEIMDSQETGFAATQSPQHVHGASLAQRKQPSRSPRTAQTLHHASSLEEIATFPANSMQRQHRDVEARPVDHKLFAKLNADDKQRQKAKQPKLGSRQSPVILERAEEPEAEAMDIDSQGADPMDTADDVIHESPEARRSSPPLDYMWVSGESLPN